MTPFTNDPPANCGGCDFFFESTCKRCDRFNPFRSMHLVLADFEPDINIDSDGPRCLSFSARHPRPDYQEAAP